MEFRTWAEINNFNFDKDLGGLKFQFEGDNSFITTTIPINLISEPFSVLLDDEKIIFHKYNENGTHVWLNMRPQHSGEITIIGTVIPDFSNVNQIQPVEYLTVIFVLIGITIAVVFFKRKK